MFVVDLNETFTSNKLLGCW